MRSSWKGLFINNLNLSESNNINQANIRVSRNSIITPFMANGGFVFEVHNGRGLFPINLRGNGVGLKLGSFVHNKSLGGKIHTEKKKDKKNKK